MAYIAVARLGLKLASIHGNVSPVWPATGLAMWLLIRLGRGLWPAIAVGAFVANVLTDVPVAVAVEIAAGNTLEALVGVWLWRRAQVPWHGMQELRELTGCLAASLLGPMASASVGVAALLFAGAVPANLAGPLWVTWWTGDALGALTVLPVLLAGPEIGRMARAASVRDAGKAGLLLAVTAGVSWFAFLVPSGGAFIFAVFPVLLLAMTWFGAAGARGVALLVSTAGIAAAYFGHGPFTTGDSNYDLLNLQVFLAAVTITALMLPVFGSGRGGRLSLAVLLVGWTLSGLVFAASQREAMRSTQELLGERIAAAETSVRARMKTYVEALRGGVSLFAASESVQRNEWRAYVDSLELPRRFPGISGVGVVFPVKPEEAEAFLQRIRQDGTPDFFIHPVPGAVSPSVEEKYVISYLEPRSANREALGLDLASESNRLEAANRARDTGEPCMTRRISLVQDDRHRAGFLLLVPFYRQGMPTASVADRRVGLAGWIDTAFITEDFLRGVLGAQENVLQLYFFETGGLDREHLLYASAQGEQNLPAKFDRVTELELEGQRFQLGWRRGPRYPGAGASPLVWVAASFALATLLLAGLVASLQTFRERAERLAAERTIELEKTRQRLATANLVQRGVLDGANFSIISTTTDGTIVSFNATAEKQLGYSGEEMIGRCTPVIIHVAEEIAARAAELASRLNRPVQPGFEALIVLAREGKVDEREWTYVRKDGTRFPVLMSISALRDAQGNVTGFLGTAQDLSSQKQMALALQNSEQRLQQVLGQADCLVWEAQVVVSADDWNWHLNVHPSGLYQRLMGRPQPAQAGLWYQFDIPEQAEMNARCREAMLGGLTEYVQEFRLLKEGRTIWMRESVSIHRPAKDQYWLVGVAIDVTGQKEIQHAREEIIDRLNKLGSQVPGMIYQFRLRPDGSSCFPYASEGIREIYRVTPEEVREDASKVFSVLHPDDLAAVTESILASARELSPWKHEYRVRYADGAERWLQGSSRPEREPDGSILWHGFITDITDRKEAELKMHLDEERLRMAAAAAGFAVWEWDVLTGKIRWDERMFSLYNVEPTPTSEVDYKTWSDKVHPEDLAEQEEVLNRLVAKGGRGEREFRIIRQVNESMRFIQAAEMVVQDRRGKSVRVVGINIDITGAKMAKAAMEESEERFRQAFEFAGIGMAIVGLDGRWLRVNQMLCDIVGYTADGLMKKTFQAITHPDDLAADLHMVQELLQGTRRSYQMEKRYFHRDGHLVWIRLTASLVRDAAGAPVNFVSQIEDITVRKQLEKALKESEERTRLFAEHAPAAVAMFDREMRYVVHSAQWLRDYGLEGRDIIGRSHYEIFPEIGETWKEIHRRCLAGATEINEADPFDRADGQRQWLSWRVQPWHDDGGTIGGIVMFTEDITQRKNLESNLATARDQALEASRLKSEFLATMSHEIRTPMNAVIGMAGLLAETPLNPKQQQMTGMIVGGAENLLAIINDILDFSRIEAGRMRIDPVEFNFNRVLEETVAFLAPRAHEKQLELTCEIGPWSGALLMGDSGRVRQILTNLMGNAIKFTDRGQVDVVVRAVHETGQRSRLQVAVSDTGVGIPREAQGRIFQSFMQADGSSTRRFGGTGLGLAITQQLVELMGGKIGFESVEGRGSRFWFELEFAHSGTVLSEPPFGLPPGKRVLVVDDNETSRRVLQTQLGRLGLDSAAVAGGEAALQKLTEAKAGPWDLLLVDGQMPGMSGAELLGHIRRNPALANLPVVMMSAAGWLADARESAPDFAGVLTKPVAEAALKQCLLRVFRFTAGLDLPEVRVKKRHRHQGLRLLLVEDNSANQQVATMLLEKMGCEVALAVNGLAALEQLAVKDYQAVLMDCQMPVMDGYEAARRIRSGAVPGVNPRVPIIALTAYARTEDRVRCLQAGMNDFASKPIREAELEAALERCGFKPLSAPAGSGPELAPLEEVFDREALETARALPGLSGSSLLPELVKLYLSDEAQRLSRIGQLAEERQAEPLAQEVHSLGGNAASFGAIQVRRIALELETAARAQDWVAVPEQLQNLREACARLKREIAHLELVTP